MLKAALLSILDLIRSEPVAVASALEAALALGVAFGLHISPEQKAAILVLAGALLAVLTRSQVSPVISAPAKAQEPPAA